MKQFNSYKDIPIKWNDSREKWQANLRALNCVPARPCFDNKAGAIEAAKQAFDKYHSGGFDNTLLGAGTVPKFVLKVQQTFEESGI